jgi:hypothetical protein
MVELSKKNITKILLEAFIVGVGLVIIVKFLQIYLIDYIPDLFGNGKFMELLFISGALFHLICEYTGLNYWYAKDYCSIKV